MEHLGVCQINGSNFVNLVDVNPFCNLQRSGASLRARAALFMRAKKKKKKEKKSAQPKFVLDFPNFWKVPLKASQRYSKVQDGSTTLREVLWPNQNDDPRKSMTLFHAEISEMSPPPEFPPNFQGEIFNNDLGGKI